jgi:hypothetical protein
VPAWIEAEDGALLLVFEQRHAGATDVCFRRVEPGAELDRAGIVVLDGDPTDASQSVEPRIASDLRELVVVAWQDSRGGPHIRARRSTDGGRTWPEPAALVSGIAAGTDTPIPATMPSVAVGAQGVAWIAWEDRRDGERDVYLARSTDGGATWSPGQSAESDVPGASTSFHPQLLTLSADVLLLVWWDERDGLPDLYARRSTDAGASWAAAEARLDAGRPGAVSSRGAVLSTRDGRTVVSWVEGPSSDAKRVARASTDFGATWSTAAPHEAAPSDSLARAEIVDVDGEPTLRVRGRPRAR